MARNCKHLSLLIRIEYHETIEERKSQYETLTINCVNCLEPIYSDMSNKLKFDLYTTLYSLKTDRKEI